MRRGLVLLVALVLLLGVAGAALAQTGGGYDLTWWTVDGGGGRLEGGGYVLDSTAGQADAGPALSGGGYGLAGGFWVGVAGGESMIYLPLLMRSF
jgi:hypothetical protein